MSFIITVQFLIGHSIFISPNLQSPITNLVRGSTSDPVCPNLCCRLSLKLLKSKYEKWRHNTQHNNLKNATPSITKLNIKDQQHNTKCPLCRVSCFVISTLRVIMLSVVLMNVVAPEKIDAIFSPKYCKKKQKNCGLLGRLSQTCNVALRMNDYLKTFSLYKIKQNVKLHLDWKFLIRCPISRIKMPTIKITPGGLRNVLNYQF